MNRLPLALLSLASTSLFAASPAAGSDQAPRLVSAVQPVRPSPTFHFGTSGAVDVAFTITAEGDVANVTVKNSTDPLLNEPALKAIRQWKFTPAMKHGQPVAVQARQTFNFESQYATPGSQRDLPPAAPAPKTMVATAK